MTTPTQRSTPPESLRPVRNKPASGWPELNLHELWDYRDLLIILLMRDIKLRYKQTALGVLWVILQPLLTSLILAVVFGVFADLPSGDVPYLLFVFAGMLPWNVFSGALQRAGNSLVTDERLISKVYFPRMAIPIASSGAVVFDFLVAFVVLLVFLAAYQAVLTWQVVLIPVLLLLTLIVSVGISLFFSALNVYYRDFMYMLPFIVQVWMYASPVAYSADLISGPARVLFALNPMFGIIQGFRWALLDAGDFSPFALGITAIEAGVLFVIGAMVFQRVERNFADVI